MNMKISTMVLVALCGCFSEAASLSLVASGSGSTSSGDALDASTDTTTSTSAEVSNGTGSGGASGNDSGALLDVAGVGSDSSGVASSSSSESSDGEGSSSDTGPADDYDDAHCVPSCPESDWLYHVNPKYPACICAPLCETDDDCVGGTTCNPISNEMRCFIHCMDPNSCPETMLCGVVWDQALPANTASVVCLWNGEGV